MVQIMSNLVAMWTPIVIKKKIKNLLDSKEGQYEGQGTKWDKIIISGIWCLKLANFLCYINFMFWYEFNISNSSHLKKGFVPLIFNKDNQ